MAANSYQTDTPGKSGCQENKVGGSYQLGKEMEAYNRYNMKMTSLLRPQDT